MVEPNRRRHWGRVPLGTGMLTSVNGDESTNEFIDALVLSKVKVSKVNAAICIAHRPEHASNALLLPISRR